MFAIGQMLARERPVTAIVQTKDGERLEWSIGEKTGIILDPDVSISRVILRPTMVPEEQELKEGEEEPQIVMKQEISVRIVEVIPWSEIKRITFDYEEESEETPLASTPATMTATITGTVN